MATPRLLLASLLVSALCTACGVREIRGGIRAVAPVTPRPGAAQACVAFSGGGIRSGAVSLGVLQELSARGQLPSVPVLSVVSGGGYPVYGLIYEMGREGATQEQLLAEGSRHIRRVEKNAGFIGGNRRLLPSAVLAVGLWAPLGWFSSGYSGAQPTYMATIHRTFTGRLYPVFGAAPSLASARRSGFPLTVFGAAVSSGVGMPLGSKTYGAEEYFEMAADVSGSSATGWIDGFPAAVELGEAVAISAAGIDLPNRSGLYNAQRDWGIGAGMSVRARGTSADTVDFYLADAGPVDNLGLLPLLRRGCTAILAVDNTFDPRMEFADWRRFASRAADLGWGVGDSLAPEGGVRGDSTNDAWRLPTHFWNAKLVKGDTTVSIRVIKLGYSVAHASQYPSEVVEKASENWSRIGQRCNSEGKLRARCGFPMEATVRQTFSVTEFRAYRKLGRCMMRLSVDPLARCDQ